MIPCPQCFHVLPTDRRAWTCATPSCARDETDGVASSFAGYDVPVRPSARDSASEHAARTSAGRERRPWPPSEPTCAQCGIAMRPSCTTCGFVLPQAWGTGDVTCVVLTGARASGKSLYIAMVVEKLERLLLEHATSQMQPASPEVAQAYETHYAQPLLDRRVLQATPVASSSGAYQRVPLIFDLGSIRGRRQFLVLRDVAGEDLQDLPRDRQHLSFVGRADAVLFLVDPLTAPDVRANLQGVIPLPTDVGQDPVGVLRNVLALVREGDAGRTPPVAVVVSKFDVLEELRGMEDRPAWSELLSHRGAAIARDPSDVSLAYDAVDGDLLDAEVRSLMQRLGGSGIVAMLENPFDGRPLECRFFAVSVLGHAPRGEWLDGRGMAPFRVLGPLRWALSRAQVL